MSKSLQKELLAVAGNGVQWDCPLAPYTSFGIGGPADALVVVETSKKLGELLDFFKRTDICWHLIGRGSNLLVADAGFTGVVLLLGKGLSEIEDLTGPDAESVQVRAGAGCSLAKLLNWCTDRGYSGLEFATGIPGSLGGAVVMNAGAQGEEIGGLIGAVEVISQAEGNEKLSRDKLEFSYRNWVNQGDYESKRMVLFVELSLKRQEKEKIRNRCRENLQMRKEKQPKVEKNAGSFFKNPNGDSAGRLIDVSGLKGRSYGGAMVSPVHGNFLVNTGSATAEDVCHLMDIVTKKVREDSGIQLFPEVHFL